MAHSQQLSGIYSITNTMNGSMYIGSASFMDSRKYRHFGDLAKGVHKNPYLQNAYNKYGKRAFQFALLEEVDDAEGLVPQEQYWIDRAIGLKINLYNIALKAGSNLGRKMGPPSQATRDKIRISNTGKPSWWKGKVRHTHCPKGHERTPDNVYISGGQCKKCVYTRNHARDY